MTNKYYACIDCGNDTQYDDDRTVNPYRCSSCKTKIIKRISSITGSSDYSSTEYGLELDWQQWKLFLDNCKYDFSFRAWIIPDKNIRNKREIALPPELEISLPSDYFSEKDK